MKITSQKQLRVHGVPSFCYLCGGALDDGRKVNDDHCPPKGLFAAADRSNFLIILPTHETCNHGWNEADEMVGIVTDALHSRKKSQDFKFTDRLRREQWDFGADTAVAVSNVPLAPMAARVVRGMYALLYKEFLPVSTKSKFHIPLPAGDTDSHKVESPLEQTFAFSAVIKKSLLTNTADLVRAYNGNFKYACTWNKLDNGETFCIICFDIYSFHNLAPPVTNFPKTFVGMYISNDRPVGAARATGLDIKLTQEQVLDPWK